MRLQLGLLNEVEGPGVNGWSDALKYQCIPMFPDIPSSYNKDLHEETVIVYSLSCLRHSEEREVVIPLHANFAPASSSKAAVEEQMKCCFFNVLIAHHTVKISPIDMVVPSIDSLLVFIGISVQIIQRLKAARVLALNFTFLCWHIWYFVVLAHLVA